MNIVIAQLCSHAIMLVSSGVHFATIFVGVYDGIKQSDAAFVSISLPDSIE